MNKYRDLYLKDINKNSIGKTITVSGWVNRSRDHGNLLFIDLRDHYGITQCVIENKNKFFKTLEKIKPESELVIDKLNKIKKHHWDLMFEYSKEWEIDDRFTEILKNDSLILNVS